VELYIPPLQIDPSKENKKREEKTKAHPFTNYKKKNQDIKQQRHAVSFSFPTPMHGDVQKYL